MPIVTVAPVINDTDEILRTFTDSVGTLPVTYTYLVKQEKITVTNKGTSHLILTVGVMMYTIPPNRSQTVVTPFTEFIIYSTNGTQSFEAISDEVEYNTDSTQQEQEIFTKIKDHSNQLGNLSDNVNNNLAVTSKQLGVTDALPSSKKMDFLSNPISNKLRLDIDTDFHVDDLLPSEMAKKIVKSNRHIKSAHGYNLYEKKLESSELYFIGKINSGNSFMAKLFDKIKRGQEVKIVIVGDSISTAADYSSFRQMPGLAESNGPNTNTTINTWAYHFSKQLMSLFPSAQITVYNRSIGGVSYNQFQQKPDVASAGHTLAGRENYDANKTWYENVKACNPDLVILSMGMNHLGDHYTGFMNNFYYPALADGFLNSADFAILTTPNPAFINTSANGDFRQYTYNAYKIAMQIQQKSLAKRFNWYCIDVGKLSTLYRYGLDFDSLTVESVTTDETVSVRLGTVATGTIKPAGVYNRIDPTIPEIRLISDDYNFFGQHSWDIGFAAEFFNSANNRMTYFITPGCAIKILGNRTVYLEDNLTQKSTTFTGTSISIRVDVLPNSLLLWINAVPTLIIQNPIYEDTNPTNYVWGMLGSGWVADLRLNHVKTPKFTKYNKVASHNDFFNADTNSANWIDGGVNHPTSLGVAHTYNLAVNEFIQDMKQAYDVYVSVEKTKPTVGPTTSRPTTGLEAGKTIHFDDTLGKPVWVKTVGTKEVASLQITAAATSAGTVTATLNGSAIPVSVAINDTPAQIADKFRATIISGWYTGGAKGTDTVTFTATTSGNKTDAAYSSGTTGTAGTITTTIQGTADVWVDSAGTSV